MKLEIDLCGLLFIVFLVLRLTDKIDWAWYWVAMPLIWPFVLVALAAIGLGGAAGAAGIAGVITGPFRRRAIRRRAKRRAELKV